MADAPVTPDSEAIHFATSLSPHRSLSPEGFKWLMRAVIAANVAIGLPLFLLGAWPVFGFMGLDVLLLWFLFKRNFLDARRSETLVLTDRELIIDRVAPDGEREESRLDAYWLRVEAGERLTERQLLEALLIPSGNNIARMLAARVAGDEAGFVDDMNAEAEELGRGVRPDFEAKRDFADCHRIGLPRAPDHQQSLMLLRMDAGGVGRLVAEMQKLPQFRAKIGQMAVIAFRKWNRGGGVGGDVRHW